MMAREIDSLFDELAQSRRELGGGRLAEDLPIYIYGAGNIGKDVCRILKRRNRPVAAFLDRKAKPDSVWEGTPILLPDSETLTREQRKNAQTVIGIFNRDGNIDEIKRQLDSLGYGPVISFLEFHDEFHAELGDRFWLTDRDFYLDQRQAIAETDELWSDAASRTLYRSLLRLRFTMRDGAMPEISREDQYFPSDIPAWPAPLRFVDCGAFDGDTLRHLADSGRQMEAVAAFEPDLANYEKLAEFAGSGKLNAPGTICLFPCGVGARTGRIRFSEGQGEGSKVCETGEAVIPCVTLDSALVGFRPNLIKMDIEGSELDALMGARRILRENRPGLAICVYHRPGHLWEIPNLVEQLLPGGRHFLRGHAYNGLELVYYWVP